jgi:hypothetical protein
VKKSKYTKEQIAAARAEYRAASKVITATRKILHGARRRRFSSFGNFERRVARLEERVKKLAERVPRKKKKAK